MLCNFIYIFIKPKLLNGLILLVWWSQHSLHLLSRLASPLISPCNVVCVHFSACNPLVNQALNRLLREHLSNSTQGSPASALTQPQENCHIQLLPKSFGRGEITDMIVLLLHQKHLSKCHTMCLLLQHRYGPHLSHVSSVSCFRHILAGAATSLTSSQKAELLRGSSGSHFALEF